MRLFYLLQAISFSTFTITLIWSDRRSRRVFLVFTRTLFFKQTGTKFQTFAYNSRTVESSCMKSWQQFEINKLFVCTKIWGNKSRYFNFKTWKPSQKLSVKSGLIQKQLKCSKKYFSWLYVLQYPFIPNKPLLAVMSFFLLFPFFFFFSS